MTENPKGQWGGPRPNSGRPVSKDGKAVKFQVSCPQKDYERMNALAEREGVNRSQLIVDAVRLFDKNRGRNE